MNRRTFLATQAAAVTTLSLAGCTGGGGGEDDTTTATPAPTPTETEAPSGDGGGGGDDEDETFVALNFKWVPDLMEIEAGTTVTWRNDDVPEHSAVSASFSEHAASWDFDSGTLQQGDTAEFTFEEEGVYHFACGVHGEDTGCGAILVGMSSLPGEGLPCTKADFG